MSSNTKYGLDSLPNDSGANNTAIGAYACYSNSGANNNTALGSNSAFRNTSGSNNTSLGTGSMCNNTTGSLNTAVGSSALEGNIGSVGDENTAIGVQSLYENQGSLNTAIGAYSALGVTGGNYNTFLGANSSTVSNLNYDYSTAIGYNSLITSSNQIMMGGSNPAGFPNVIIPGNAYLPNFTAATNEYQIVPKGYVDTLASGLKPTQACICATTDDIDLSLTTAPSSSSTDGFDFSTQPDGDYYVLVINQGGSPNTLTSSIQNGVYILNINSGTYTWSRPPSPQPMYTGFDAAAVFSFVQYGDTYPRSALVQINNPAIVGTNPLAYQLLYQFNYQLGQGLNATTVGLDTFINVDSSLNFIQYLDNTGGTLSLGAYSNATNIGYSSGTTTIAGTLNVTGATTFNISLPTSTLTPSSGSQLTTKTYVDNAISSSSTNLLVTNNSWSGTNAFNSFLPTSTLTPSSGSQLTTKTYVDNAISSSSTNLLASNNSWSGTNTFSQLVTANSGISVTGYSEITTTGLGGSQTFTLYDTTSGNRMRFALNCSAANWNPLVQSGDQVISAGPVNAGKTLTLCSNSSNNTNGVRITETSVLIGAGGNSATPTSAISFSGSTVTVTGTATFNTSLPTSTLTPSSNSQLTTKVYVDTAISSSSSNLLASNNTWTGTNTFNSFLPTSTLTPSSGSQLTTKTYVDSLSSNLLASNNTWSGINTFQTNTYLATSSGSVGIGTTSTYSGYKLDVNGKFLVRGLGSDGGQFAIEDASSNFDSGYNYFNSTGDNKGLKIFWDYPNNGAGRTTFLNCGQGGQGGFDFYQCYSAGITPVRATLTCGKLGIGLTNPSYNLDVSGNANITGATSLGSTLTVTSTVTASAFNTTSDYRIKENVEILNETHNVDNLRPVTYLNKTTNKQDIGLIAHEVQEVFSCLVNGEKDGEEIQSVNYIGLIPILIKEIQQLKKEIKMLKEK